MEEFEEKLTIENRDRMLLKRMQILNEYSKKNQSKGIMYYIYSNNTEDINKYNVCICNNGQSYKTISIERSQLPVNATIGSCLRNENGKYIIDYDATDEVLNSINQALEELRENQKNELENLRIDGHTYLVNQNDGKRIWLEDIQTGKVFEELENEDIIHQAKVLEKIQWKNGKYQII